MLNSEIYGAEVWGLIGSLQQAEPGSTDADAVNLVA